jgi:PAS domain S-box-containing protein
MKKANFDQTQEKEPRRHSIRQDLQRQLVQQEAIAWFGEFAIQCRILDELLDQAVTLVARTLGAELCKVLQLLPGGQALLIRSGIGWRDGIVGKTIVETGPTTQAGFTLLTDESIIVDRLKKETRFSGHAILHDHGVVSGMTVVIRGKHGPWGILGAHSSRRIGFTDHDARFLKSIASILGSAIDRFLIEDELRRSRDEIEIILNGISEGITAQDSHGRLLYANQAAAEIIGYASAEELLSTPLHKVMERFEVLDGEGDPFPVDRLPGRLVLQGSLSANELVRFRIQDTGKERWSMVSARPVHDISGKVVMAVNIFRDITAFKKAEKTQKLLADAGDLLASDFDVRTRMDNLARLSVMDLADWCAVHLVDEKQQIIQLAVAHKDPAKVELAHEYEQRYPPDWGPGSALARVMRTGQPEFFPEVTEEMLAAGVRDAEQLEWMHRLGLVSGIIMPLIARGRVLGTLTLVWSDRTRPYTQADVDLIQELARRAAIAIDNGLLFREIQALNVELEQRVVERTRQVEVSHRRLIQEVEERRKAEAALKVSEALLHGLFEYAPDATLLVDKSGKILRANHQAEVVFGYPVGDLVGNTIEQLLPERYRHRHPHHRVKFMASPTTRPMGIGLDLHGMRSDGSDFPVDIMLSPVRLAGGEQVICAVRDITQQKRLQLELAETHRGLFESIEAERQRLSRDLHDGPIQDLYGVIFSFVAMRSGSQISEEL